MPSVSSEIIAEITDHIRKFGGPFTAWCVGTARDWHSPVLVAHQIEEKHDALISREAYTPGGARTVRDYFATQFGSFPGNGEESQDGKLVYAFKNSVSHPCPLKAA